MRNSQNRTFQLLDVLVLIAATAVALLATRHMEPIAVDSPTFIHVATVIRYDLFVASFFVSTWALALLLLRLRQPRPPWHRLVRNPGTTASLGVLVVLIARGIGLLLMIGLTVIDIPSDRKLSHAVVLIWDNEDLQATPSEMGYAVAAIWAIQRLGHRWRAEPSWLDRSGRVLGLFWLVTIPFAWMTFVDGEWTHWPTTELGMSKTWILLAAEAPSRSWNPVRSKGFVPWGTDEAS